MKIWKPGRTIAEVMEGREMQHKDKHKGQSRRPVQMLTERQRKKVKAFQQRIAETNTAKTGHRNIEIREGRYSDGHDREV